jgi:flagellar hook protein FlgE
MRGRRDEENAFMGIFGAMSTAVAGLRAQSFAIENISGNIANSQTTGFKRVDTSFVDLIPDAPPIRQLAGSVFAMSRASNAVQGDVRDSEINTFMAINGQGMFVVDEQTSTTDGRPVFSGVDKYTRRGDFQLDRNGFLRNGAGYYLKGLPVDPRTGNPSASVPEVIRITSDFQPARASTQISYRANLAQLPRTPAYNPAVPNSELLVTGSPTAGRFTATNPFAATGPFDADDAISFNISVNGGAPTAVIINQAAVAAVGNADNTIDSAAELQAILTAAGVTGVTASLNAGRLELTSGTTGPGSAVTIAGYAVANPNASAFTDSTGVGAGTSTAGVAAGAFNNDPRVTGAGFVRADDSDDFLQRSIEGGGLTLYDGLGSPVNVQFRWAKTTNTVGSEQWNLFYLENSAATGANPMWRAVPQNYTFDAQGRLAPSVPSVTIPAMTINGKALGSIVLQHGDNGLTQFQDPNGNAQLTAIDQDGYPAGELSSVAVNDGGAVVGTYTNGRSQVIAQVTLATFKGVDQLKRLDGGTFAATQESGVPILGGAGNIQGGALESSNTDIADEFTKLIVTQQAYTANTRVVSTADDMLREALNMIR